MKIVIESLLTGSQFEVVIGEHDKILMVKSNIQKVLGEAQCLELLSYLGNSAALRKSLPSPKIENFSLDSVRRMENKSSPKSRIVIDYVALLSCGEENAKHT